MIKLSNHNKGFTLIELLVVISVIGVLSTIIISNISKARQRSQNTAYMAEVKQVQKALEMYYLDHGVYPTGERFTYFSEIEADLASYMQELPEDKSPTVHNTMTIYGTEYTGDGGCTPEGTNSSNTTNGDSSYVIRYILSSKVNDEFYYHSSSHDWYYHCARPLLK